MILDIKLLRITGL